MSVRNTGGTARTDTHAVLPVGLTRAPECRSGGGLMRWRANAADVSNASCGRDTLGAAMVSLSRGVVQQGDSGERPPLVKRGDSLVDSLVGRASPPWGGEHVPRVVASCGYTARPCVCVWERVCVRARVLVRVRARTCACVRA